MVSDILVNTGSRKALLPDGTKPLPGPMLTDHGWRFVAFNWPVTESAQILIDEIDFENHTLWLQPHLPGVNGLIPQYNATVAR